ncbi:MAG: T9SS type A sorting domain-containing protein [Candidatus Marinimicrobia bacterium]|nr:T9SS type A sorting domain-containing protein [Candidatus Neomarinimicrobiota bacterium]
MKKLLLYFTLLALVMAAGGSEMKQPMADSRHRIPDTREIIKTALSGPNKPGLLSQWKKDQEPRFYSQNHRQAPPAALHRMTARTSLPYEILIKYLYDNSEKYTYQYNGAGNMTEELYEYYYLDNLEESSKSLYTYDGQGNPLTDVYQSLVDGSWINIERYTYTHDNNGQVQTEIYDEYIDGNWVSIWKWVYTWSNGMPLQILEQTWDGSAWTDEYLYAVSYDEDGNILQTVLSYFDGASWEIEGRMTWTYDANGNELTLVSEELNESDVLTYSSRETNSYNGDGNLSESIMELYEEDAWHLFFRYLFTYDEYDNVLSETDQMYDEESGTWIELVVITYTYTYDGNGNVTEEIESSVMSAWGYEQLNKKSYNYDENNDCYYGICMTSYDGSTWEIGEGNLFLPFNNGTDAVEETAHEISINFNEPTGIEEEVHVATSATLNQNYPNPFNPATTIAFTLPAQANVRLSVYNSLGQLVNELVDRKLQQGVYQYTFDASALNSGIYFYKLQTDGNTMVKKMVLIK